MFYLIGQILFLLLLTALMSGAMGWLLRSFGHENQSRQSESEWAAKLAGLRRARDDYRDQLEQLKTGGAQLLDEAVGDELSDEQKAGIAAHVRQLEEEVKAGRERLASLTRKLEGVVESSARRESEYNALRERLDAATEGLRERDQRLAEFQAKVTDAARQQTHNAQNAKRELEDHARELEQTLEVQKLRISELENGPEAAQEQVEHSKLLNVIQAQKKTIASLNQRIRTSGENAGVPVGHGGDAALAEVLKEREAAIHTLQERVRGYKRQQERALDFETENARLQEALAMHEQTIADLESHQAGLASRSDTAAQAELIERLEMRDETIAHLQNQLRTAESQGSAGEQDEHRYARMMEIIRAQEETIARLNERLRQPVASLTQNRTVARAGGPGKADTLSGDLFEDKPATILDAPDGEPDNLKRIHGVGPILEGKLNELGVYHFRQIAAFGDEEIAWISTHMSSFPNRVIRDRWIDQAVELERARRANET